MVPVFAMSSVANNILVNNIKMTNVS
jgi:hypothetical protein